MMHTESPLRSSLFCLQAAWFDFGTHGWRTKEGAPSTIEKILTRRRNLWEKGDIAGLARLHIEISTKAPLWNVQIMQAGSRRVYYVDQQSKKFRDKGRAQTSQAWAQARWGRKEKTINEKGNL